MWEVKQNKIKTGIHMKVTHALQQKISSNINKLKQKEIKRMSGEMFENKKLLFDFFFFSKKKLVDVVSTLKTGQMEKMN